MRLFSSILTFVLVAVSNGVSSNDQAFVVPMEPLKLPNLPSIASIISPHSNFQDSQQQVTAVRPPMDISDLGRFVQDVTNQRIQSTMQQIADSFKKPLFESPVPRTSGEIKTEETLTTVIAQSSTTPSTTSTATVVMMTTATSTESPITSTGARTNTTEDEPEEDDDQSSDFVVPNTGTAAPHETKETTEAGDVSDDDDEEDQAADAPRAIQQKMSALPVNGMGGREIQVLVHVASSSSTRN